MAFSYPPEVETLAALDGVLHPLGYHVSQQVRLMDAIEAAAENPSVCASPGPTLGDFVVSALRDASGPLRPDHPWLEPDDWRYAKQAHFDFLVQEGTRAEHPTHPLFAVEFDARSTHSSPAAHRRDLQKNRLCAASGLPLVRIDYTFLHRRERLSTIEWLARTWAAYRTAMPHLLAERDAEVDAMSGDKIDAAGPFLLSQHPHLDVDFVFQLEHPFPPIRRLIDRLARNYGFQWFGLGIDVPTPDLQRPRWKVEWECPAYPALNPGRIERWTVEVGLLGPDNQQAEFRGVADVATCYPLRAGEVETDPRKAWDEVLVHRRLPALPAGPWFSAPSMLGQALCTHNRSYSAGGGCGW